MCRQIDLYAQRRVRMTTAANNSFMGHPFSAEIRPYRGSFNIIEIFNIVFSLFPFDMSVVENASGHVLRAHL